MRQIVPDSTRELTTVEESFLKWCSEKGIDIHDGLSLFHHFLPDLALRKKRESFGVVKGIRGVMAKQRIEQGEVLCEVPLKCSLTYPPRHLREGDVHPLQLYLETLPSPPSNWMALVLLVASEKLKSMAHLWTPFRQYLDILPSASAMLHPIYLSQSEQQCLSGTTAGYYMDVGNVRELEWTGKVGSTHKKTMQDIFLSAALPVMEGKPDLWPTKGATNEARRSEWLNAFLYSVAIVLSRGFHLGSTIKDESHEIGDVRDSEHCEQRDRAPFLIPVVDMFNHSSVAPHCHVNLGLSVDVEEDEDMGDDMHGKKRKKKSAIDRLRQKSKTRELQKKRRKLGGRSSKEAVFRLTAEIPIPSSAEVFTSYGENLSSAVLYKTYGFVEESHPPNPFDEAILQLDESIKVVREYLIERGIVGDKSASPFLARRLAILSRKGILPRYFSSGEDEGTSFEQELESAQPVLSISRSDLLPENVLTLFRVLCLPDPNLSAYESREAAVLGVEEEMTNVEGEPIEEDIDMVYECIQKAAGFRLQLVAEELEQKRKNLQKPLLSAASSTSLFDESSEGSIDAPSGIPLLVYAQDCAFSLMSKEKDILNDLRLQILSELVGGDTFEGEDEGEQSELGSEEEGESEEDSEM